MVEEPDAGSHAVTAATIKAEADRDPRLGRLAVDMEENDVAQRAFRSVTIMRNAEPGDSDGASQEYKADANYHLALLAYCWLARLLPQGIPGAGLPTFDFLVPPLRVYVRGLPPGVALPMSGQCARTHAKPSRVSASKAGVMTFTSGR